jgi:dihydroneopterin aldolase
MIYTCSIENAEFHAYHGLYPEEKLTGGTFIVNVHVVTERSDDDPLNQLDSVMDYEHLFTLIKETMDQREDLIETVATKLLNRIPVLFHDALHAEVSITKPDPAGLFKTGSATVKLKKTYKKQ